MKKTLALFLVLFVIILTAVACDLSEEPAGTTDTTVTTESTSLSTTETTSTTTHVHNYGEWEVVKEATCTVDGEQARKCSCGDTQTETIKAKGHTEVDVAGKDATCTADGLTAGKKCSVCGEFTVKQEVIKAKGHTVVSLPGIKETCTEDGLTAGEKCSVCGEILVAQEVIKAGHKEADVAGKEATCTENGLTAGKKCSVCGEVLVAQEVIPAKGHTEVAVPGKEATCTADGLTAGKKCSVCGEVLVAQEVIPAKGHTEVVVAGKEATCTADGLTAGKKCSVCGEFTVKQEIIPATNHKATSSVVFYTKGENPVAIVIATNKNLGTLVAGEGIEALVQGNFYVVNSCGCTNTAVADLGAAVADKQVTAGWTNVKSNGRVQSYNTYLIRSLSLKNFTLNSYMDEAALNSAMGAYASMGKFGTVTLTNVDGKNAALVFDGTGEAKLITDYKWNFVYTNYDGSGLNVATGTTWTPLAMNNMELIRTAIDFALNEEAGYSRDIWVSAMDAYGGLPSIVTLDGKYNGTTIQVNNTNVWNNSIIPVRYTAALKNYEALEDSDEVIAEKLAAAEKALKDAQKALDEAVAANANVAALKAAMDKAEKALDAAKQTEYVAKVAYETEKASSGINSEASVALKAVYDEKTAKKNSAQAEYDAAKAAYDEAVNADEALKALVAALTDATNAHKTAEANQKKVDTYKEYAALYEAFLAEYSKAANVALWDVNNMEESAIVKAFANVPEDQRALPTYTYYYDAETDTYTVFVTSATDKNTIEKFTDNTPIKPYNPKNIDTSNKTTVFITMGEEPKAIEIATGKVIYDFAVAYSVGEVKGGYLYLMKTVDGKNVIMTELGAAVADKQVTGGWTNVKSNGRVQSYSTYLIRMVSLKNFTLNGYMDEAALNSAMGAYAPIGKFGTVTLTNVDGKNAALVFDGTGEAKLITDYKWNFVYTNYDGSGLNVATGTTWTPLAMNHMELIRTAIDFALGEEAGYSRDIWVSAMDTYGGLPSIVTLDGKYNGTTIQVNNTNVWNNSIIPVKYTAALKNYEALEDSDEVIAEKLAAAEKALADAQKALDEVVAANANVAALKAAVDKAEKALLDAKQVEYEARVAYETEKASSGSKSEATLALKAVYDEKTAEKNSVQAEYDTAKAAYDAAVAEDEALAALNTALTEATNAHKTAAANQKKVDTYKEYAPLYEAFLAEYSKAANVALWDVNNMEESAIVKAFANIPENQRALPTYTYYYDAKTDTYTVFVTSATDKNTIEKFTNNIAIKPYNPEN